MGLNKFFIYFLNDFLLPQRANFISANLSADEVNFTHLHIVRSLSSEINKGDLV